MNVLLVNKLIYRRAMLFSVVINVLPHLRQSMAEVLGVKEVPRHEKYLGLPTHVGRSKVEAFAYLKDRLTN
jgi:hypothetical protein